MSKILSLIGGQPSSIPCPVCGKGVTILTTKRYTGWECEAGHYGIQSLDAAGNPIFAPHGMPLIEAKKQP